MSEAKKAKPESPEGCPVEPWMEKAAKSILHAGSWPDEWEPEDATEVAAIIAKHYAAAHPTCLKCHQLLRIQHRLVALMRLYLKISLAP